MENLNKAIQFTRGIPQNKWDQGKYLEIYEKQHQELLERLERFRKEGLENEEKWRARGVPEFEIENWKFGRTNEYIQLLEAVIQSKQQIEWAKIGLRQLIQDKISLLESMI